MIALTPESISKAQAELQALLKRAGLRFCMTGQYRAILMRVENTPRYSGMTEDLALALVLADAREGDK